MTFQKLWNIYDFEDKKPSKGLTDEYIKMSINNCCNPWDCLCEQCCKKIEEKEDNYIDFLFNMRYHTDNFEIENSIKKYLIIIENSISPRDIIRNSSCLWRLLDNNEKILNDDVLKSIITEKIIELSKSEYKPSQIIVKLCKKHFSDKLLI